MSSGNSFFYHEIMSSFSILRIAGLKFTQGNKPPARIELATSSLPRTRSTTELQRHNRAFQQEYINYIILST